jgi:hypothetical protein
VSVITHGERPTFDSLTILLQEEASRKKLGFIGGPGHEQAFTARQGCWHCGKIGHKRDECLGLHPELRARGASTGPLPTPTGGRGLSPVRGERAMNVREVAW